MDNNRYKELMDNIDPSLRRAIEAVAAEEWFNSLNIQSEYAKSNTSNIIPFPKKYKERE